MKVVFIKQGNLGSAFMRGVQVAEALKKSGIDTEVREDIDDVKDSIVVFIKSADPQLIAKAKEQHNCIVYDIVDKFSRKELPHEQVAFPMVDAVIMPNMTAAQYFGGLFQHATVAVIPHHWDPRVQESCSRFSKYPYEFRLGYLGATFNHDFKDSLVDVIGIYDSSQIIEWASFFTCHYTIRQPGTPGFLFKPATKLSTAAAVNANCITTRDSSTIELLGEDYPYYVDDYSPEGVFKVIKNASETFEEEEWYAGLKMMKDVRERTSLETCIEQYKILFAELTKQEKVA